MMPIQLELTRQPLVRAALKSRWPQFLIQAVTLAGFLFVIVVGLFGSPVGNASFALLFVWIAWWTALKLVLIPLGGRAWCSICPIPLPGEWLQRGALLNPRGGGWGLRRRWPRRLRGVWLQAGGFALIGLFGIVILTEPRVTAWVLVSLIGLASVLGVLFERRAFCRYVCPVGGFTGLYARLAPVELRVKDPALCAQHAQKLCYTGCGTGYGCPWGNFPAALRDNADCGLCFECLRTCPYDNLALNVRPFGRDALKTPARLAEAALSLVMLGSVLVYSALFLGPWGGIKSAAYQVGSTGWRGYALAFLSITLLLIPALFLLAVWSGRALSRARTPLRQAFAAQARALAPLGLAAWMAFTVAFAFVKFPFVWAVLSDPLNLGWNLLGRASVIALPDAWALSTAAQVVSLMIGMFAAARVATRSAQLAQALPVLGFCLLFTLVLLWLLVG
jgi:polyferredoxin